MQFSNEAGRRLLARAAVLKITRKGRIALNEAHETDWLYRCFRDLEDRKQATGLRVEDDDGPLSLCVAPFHPRMSEDVQADRDVFENTTLFAIFVGTQGETAVNPGLLQDVFKLTKREAEVASHIVTGKSPAEISEITGRAEKTIRNQVQAVLEKVGVKSTGALAEALSVFRVVGAMYDPDDPVLYSPEAGVFSGRLS